MRMINESRLQFRLSSLATLLFLRCLVWELTGDKFGRIVNLRSVVFAHLIEVQRRSKRFEFRLLLDLPSTSSSWTQSPCIFLYIFRILHPLCSIQLRIFKGSLVEQHSSVRKYFIAVVNPQSWG